MMHEASWESVRGLGRRELLVWEGYFADGVYFNTPVLSWAACWVLSCQVAGQGFGGCQMPRERNCEKTTDFSLCIQKLL